MVSIWNCLTTPLDLCRGASVLLVSPKGFLPLRLPRRKKVPHTLIGHAHFGCRVDLTGTTATSHFSIERTAPLLVLDLVCVVSLALQKATSTISSQLSK